MQIENNGSNNLYIELLF